MKLTPEQKQSINKLTDAKRAADMTLATALQYHSNCTNNIFNQEREWWAEVIADLKLDPVKKWVVKEGVLSEKPEE